MPMISINVFVIYCNCSNCGNQNTRYTLSELCYGQWLIPTCDQQSYAYINLLEDPITDELSEIIKLIHGNSDQKRAIRNFQVALCCASDPVDGIILDSSFKHICPNCLSDNVKCFDYKPPVTETITVPVVEHKAWNKLSPLERERLITSVITKK